MVNRKYQFFTERGLRDAKVNVNEGKLITIWLPENPKNDYLRMFTVFKPFLQINHFIMEWFLLTMAIFCSAR